MTQAWLSEPDEHWTLIAQLLDGVTIVGGDTSPLPTNDWDLRAAFLLTSYAWGSNRVSGRYDWFQTRQRHGYDIGEYDDDGHALTVACLRDLGERFQLGAEWLRIHGAPLRRAKCSVCHRRSTRHKRNSW